MSNRTRTLFLGLTLALTAPFGVSIGAQEVNPLRVLFVGNSYIYYNDLPSVIGDLATAAHESRPFVAEQVLVGAATLERHLALGDAMTAYVDGKLIGSFSSSGIAHETKQVLRLLVSNKVTLDDVKYYKKK